MIKSTGFAEKRNTKIFASQLLNQKKRQIWSILTKETEAKTELDIKFHL